VNSPMFLLRSLAASFLACAEPTLVYIRFIWSSGFFTVIKFSADKFFAKLPEPLSFAQPFAKVVQTFRGNWISLRERLTGKTMFYSVFAKVLKLLICIFPPRGCRFFVFFMSSALPQKTSKAETRKWRQELCSISPVDPGASSHLSTKQHNKQQRLTEKRDAYNSCDKCPDKELNLVENHFEPAVCFSSFVVAG
jgi:hypothetical protein